MLVVVVGGGGGGDSVRLILYINTIGREILVVCSF